MPSRFKSVKRRFLISLAGNGIRAGASFSAGVLVARGLGARSFGELAFLVAGFSSLRPLLDLGTSTAFFTFISRKGRLGPRFQLYLGWLSVQFILVLSVIVLLPPWAYGRFWFGYPRALVILAFVACFVQMQAWSTVTQIGESRRETLTMQILSASIALTHLGLVGWLVVGRLLSVPAVFYCLLGEYAVAVCVGGWLLSRHQGEAATDNLPAESFLLSAAGVIRHRGCGIRLRRLLDAATVRRGGQSRLVSGRLSIRGDQPFCDDFHPAGFLEGTFRRLWPRGHGTPQTTLRACLQGRGGGRGGGFGIADPVEQ